MRTWQPMSDKYQTANGFTVKVASTEAELEELGYALHNGLMAENGRSVWASLCESGKRQIISVDSPSGETIANAELKLANGKVQAIFVRGDRNAELSSGDHGYDVIQDYLKKVNSNDIAVNFNIAGTSFLPVTAATVSPFAALMGAVDAPGDEANAGDQEERSWTALTDPYMASNGLTISPMSKASQLTELGIELENNLFVPSATDFMASMCSEGSVQLASMLDQDGNPVGMVEYQVVRGQLVAVSCRGFADAEPLPSMAKAALEYAGAVNSGRLRTNLQLGSKTFSSSAEDVNIFSNNEIPMARELLPAAMRESTLYDENADYDDDYVADYDDEDNEGDLDEDEDAPDADSPLSELTVPHGGVAAPVPAENNRFGEPWTGLTGSYTSRGGMTVEIITDERRIKAVGDALETDWSWFHDNLAERCHEGLVQVACVKDFDGTVLSHVELHPNNGSIAQRFHQGKTGKPARIEAALALKEYLNAIETDAELKVNVRVGNKNFYPNKPEASLGMGL